MASIIITLTNSCPTQGHVQLGITGDRTGTIRLHVDEIFQQSLDNDALLDFLKQYLKIWTLGKTKAQMRTQLLAGLTVTI